MSSSDLSVAPPEDQARILQDALARVKVHAFHMRKSLDAERIMDALKHALELVSELRVGTLTPKNYYELYMLVFDNLRYLAVVLGDAHRAGKADLATLYELVQYSGAIVPRLYMMITVAAAYLPMRQTPVKVILRDLLDMCRGVQHPVRGLFLRHYLSSMTKDYLPDGPNPAAAVATPLPASPEPPVSDQANGAASPAPSPAPTPAPVATAAAPADGTVDDAIAFVMQNFVEMNKLWVRLQYQGPTRDRDRREEERRELRILVGTNIVRLSQLEAVDLGMYQATILPPILDQIIQCRDVIAQEYLMEVIIQVFPDVFHLQTLQPLLAVTAQLQRQVNIKQIIVALIDRLRAFASERSNAANAAKAEAESGAKSATASPAAGAAAAAPTNGAAATAPAATPSANGIPSNVQLFDVFWAQITQVITARPDLGITDIASLLLSLMQLSVTCYPTQLEYVDQILVFAREQVARAANTPELLAPATVASLQSMLLAVLQGGAVPRDPLVVVALRGQGAAFRDLLATQPYATRLHVARTLVTALVDARAVLDAEEVVAAVWECVAVLVKDQRDAPLWKNTGMFVDREAAAAALASPDSHHRDDQLEQVAMEQGLVAKLVTLIAHEETAVHAQLLSVTRKYLAEGGGYRIKYTFPALVYQAIRLVDRVAALPPTPETDREQMHLFKYLHQVITAIHLKSDDIDQATHLFLMAARAADAARSEEIAYEFFVSALTVYEECISDSRHQFLALTAIVNALLECSVFAVDNYDTLATKCTLHASRLLKRPDQCRAVIQCSHLFWPQHKEYRDGKRVLECLQKALKFADACLDTIMNVELFIETLVRYIYFYEKGCPVVTPKHVSGLLELIATNLANLHEAASTNPDDNAVAAATSVVPRGFSASSLVGLDVGDASAPLPAARAGALVGPSSLKTVTSHYRRTCQMVRERQANPPRTLGEAGPYYGEMVVPTVAF
ncbi:Vacuolar protein sorting-associated protein 35 [Allomyces javanicus]|nr:Vacuolar protein sorting-associated protein 35 [Allomyces javanicus]